MNEKMQCHWVDRCYRGVSLGQQTRVLDKFAYKCCSRLDIKCNGRLSVRHQVTAWNQGCKTWRQQWAFNMGVGGRLYKDMVSFNTAILPTQPPHPLPCCQVTMKAASSGWPVFSRAARRPLRIVLPIPNIPSPGAIPGNEYVGQWYKTGLLKAAMESVPGAIDPMRRRGWGTWSFLLPFPSISLYVVTFSPV